MPSYQLTQHKSTHSYPLYIQLFSENIFEEDEYHDNMIHDVYLKVRFKLMLNEFVYAFNKMKQRYEEKEWFIRFKFRDNIIHISLCVTTKDRDILTILIIT